MNINTQQCPNCGAPLKKGNTICEYCGNKISFDNNSHNSIWDKITQTKPIPGIVFSLDFMYNNYYANKNSNYAYRCDIEIKKRKVAAIQFGSYGHGKLDEQLLVFPAKGREASLFSHSDICQFFKFHGFHHYIGNPYSENEKEFIAQIATIYIEEIVESEIEDIILHLHEDNSQTPAINVYYNRDGETISNNIETNSDFCETTKVSKKHSKNDNFLQLVITIVFIFLTLLGLLIASTGY